MTGIAKGSEEWLTNATHVHHISCCKKNSFGSQVYTDLWLQADLETDAAVNKGFTRPLMERLRLWISS